MKRAIFTTKAIVLLLVILTSISVTVAQPGARCFLGREN